MKVKASLLNNCYSFSPFIDFDFEGKISPYLKDNFFPYNEDYYRGKVCGMDGLFIAKRSDKIVLSALANILTDRFREEMIESSFACRSDVGYNNIIGLLEGWRGVGALMIVDFDSSSLNKERLFIAAARYLSDERVIRVIEKAYEIGVLDYDEVDGEIFNVLTSRGVEVIMPKGFIIPIALLPIIGSVLFYFYLYSFDRVMEKEHTYARHLNLTFIGVPLGEDYLVKLMDIWNLIQSMGLTASPRVLVPGGPSAKEYFHSDIFLSKEGTIQVFKQNEDDGNSTEDDGNSANE